VTGCGCMQVVFGAIQMVFVQVLLPPSVFCSPDLVLSVSQKIQLHTDEAPRLPDLLVCLLASLYCSTQPEDY